MSAERDDQADERPYWLDQAITPVSLLSVLDKERFIRLCAALLQAQGYTVVRDPRASDVQVDILAEAPDGGRIVVECRHHDWHPGLGLLRRTISGLLRARMFFAADKSMLLMASPLPPSVRSIHVHDRSWLLIADVREIEAEVWSRPGVKALADELIKEVLAKPRSSGSNQIRNASPLRDKRALSLLLQLSKLKPGRDHWQAYETLVVEMVNYAFYPELGIPLLQSRSEDGLDIRDAIYPIKSQHWFWNEMRTACKTRFVVVECKNHDREPGQREVESLQQYLYAKALRTVGLLVARRPPSPSALIARRRAWVEVDSNKMILFMSDDDLAECVMAKSRGEQPEEILDAQIDEFLMSLAP